MVGFDVYFTRITLGTALRTDKKKERVEIGESSNTWPRAGGLAQGSGGAQ